MREDTQDLIAWKEVYRDNEYRLPEKFRAVDTIVDIGAHIGIFARACLDRGAGWVECYEPEPENFRLLLQNLGKEGRAHLAAVWSHRGRIALCDRGIWTCMHHTMGGEGRSVHAVTLDDILADLVDVRLLKLDCEGAEVPILESVTKMDNVREVIGELHYKMQARGDGAGEWLEHRLKDLGFPFVSVTPNPRSTERIAHFWARRS